MLGGAGGVVSPPGGFGRRSLSASPASSAGVCMAVTALICVISWSSAVSQSLNRSIHCRVANS